MLGSFCRHGLQNGRAPFCNVAPALDRFVDIEVVVPNSLVVFGHHFLPPVSGCRGPAKFFQRQNALGRDQGAGVKPVESGVQKSKLAVVAALERVIRWIVYKALRLVCDPVGKPTSEACHCAPKFAPVLNPILPRAASFPLRNADGRQNGSDRSDCLHPCRPVYRRIRWEPQPRQTSKDGCRVDDSEGEKGTGCHIPVTAQVAGSVHVRAALARAGQADGGEA